MSLAKAISSIDGELIRLKAQQAQVWPSKQACTAVAFTMHLFTHSSNIHTHTDKHTHTLTHTPSFLSSCQEELPDAAVRIQAVMDAFVDAVPNAPTDFLTGEL